MIYPYLSSSSIFIYVYIYIYKAKAFSTDFDIDAGVARSPASRDSGDEGLVMIYSVQKPPKRGKKSKIPGKYLVIICDNSQLYLSGKYPRTGW